MIKCLPDILSPQHIQQLNDMLEQLPFVDGRQTAGWHAAKVKVNKQADTSDEQTRSVISFIKQRIAQHEIFAQVALPKIFGPLLISRYDDGDAYGPHVDDAIMGSATPCRTDISFTLFLSEPGSYRGGALQLHSGAGDESYKLPPGALVMYPSASLHSVEPVADGTRYAAIGWVQSLVRDPARREVLFDINCARRAVFAERGKCETFDLLCKSYSNLLRQSVDI